MTRMRSPRIVGRIVVVLIALQLGAAPALAEPQEWNQKEASRLAGEFAQSIEKISTAAKTAGLQKTAIQQRTRDGAVNRLRGVREAADALAKQLAGGRDRSATELFFAQVRQLFQQTRAVARDAVAGDEQSSNLEAAEKLLDQLARYYEY
ncbi:MAG: hypothetical protein JRG94_17865 [Deltaproteobacteria bacterium]|nr:hypothetical protein [Deltaproteobacteria bacterium]